LGAERRALVEKNEDWLDRNQDLLDEIAAYHCRAAFAESADLDPDVALYQVDFASRSEKKLFDAFHAAPPERKGWLIERMPLGPRRQLAIRVLGRNYPSDLPEAYRAEFEAYMRRALVVRAGAQADSLRDYRGRKRLTAAAAVDEGEGLLIRGDLDAEQQTVVKEWVGYVDALRAPNDGHAS
jgi:exonuclease I